MDCVCLAARAHGQGKVFAGLARHLVGIAVHIFADPAAQVFQRDPTERIDPLRVFVERWDVMEVLAARLQEKAA